VYQAYFRDVGPPAINFTDVDCNRVRMSQQKHSRRQPFVFGETGGDGDPPRQEDSVGRYKQKVCYEDSDRCEQEYDFENMMKEYVDVVPKLRSKRTNLKAINWEKMAKPGN
jgi:hypothetical protein